MRQEITPAAEAAFKPPAPSAMATRRRPPPSDGTPSAPAMIALLGARNAAPCSE